MEATNDFIKKALKERFTFAVNNCDQREHGTTYFYTPLENGSWEVEKNMYGYLNGIDGNYQLDPITDEDIIRKYGRVQNGGYQGCRFYRPENRRNK